jgi:hypothetical protein
MGENLCRYSSDYRLISRICEELKISNSKRIIQLINGQNKLNGSKKKYKWPTNT